MWAYNETPDFIRSSEKLNLSEEIKSSIRDWAVAFRRQSTKNSSRYFCSQNNIFEIWIVRIPNPDANKGKVGGFRLALFINLRDNSINTCEIALRNKLGGKRERSGDQRRHQEYLRGLKQYLLRILES